MDKLYSQIRSVRSFSEHMDIFALIQSVNHGLLHLFIQLRVQSIDTDHLVEYLRIALPYLRNRISDDGKTPLVSPDIFIGDLPGPVVIHQGQLTLFRGIPGCFRFCLR